MPQPRLTSGCSPEDYAEKLRLSALALMAVLSEKPMTGYDIKKTLDSGEMHFWRDSFGSIYPNLKLLTGIGLVRTALSESTGRKRISYALTDAGRDVLARWLRRPADTRPVKIELLLKLRFAYRLGPEALTELLRADLIHRKDILPELYEALEYLRESGDQLHDQTRRMILDYWYRHTKMMIDWCQDWLERISDDTVG